MQPSELSSVLTMIRASHDYFVYIEASHVIRKKKSVLNFVDNFEMSNVNEIKGVFNNVLALKRGGICQTSNIHYLNTHIIISFDETYRLDIDSMPKTVFFG